MENMARVAVSKIQEFKENEVIAKFVREEALAMVAKEISAIPNRTATPKAVELLMIKHEEIRERVQKYIDAGFYGVYLKWIEGA